MNPPNPLKQPTWTTVQAQLNDKLSEIEQPESIWSLIFQACQQKISRLINAVEQGWPIFWYNYGLTPEIFMGLEKAEYVPVEFYPLLQVLLGNKEDLLNCIETAEDSGISPGLCSLLKASLGAALNGYYPKPTLVIHAPAPCPAQSGFFNFLARLNDMERVVIDIPKHRGPGALQYTGAAVSEAIHLIEEASGQRYDQSKLESTLDEADRALNLLVEWSDLRKSRLCIQSSSLTAMTGMMMVLFSGEQTGTLIAEAARDDAQRSDRAKSAVNYAVWFGKPYWGEVGFYDHIFQNLNIQFMMDSQGYYLPEDIISGGQKDDPAARLAHRLINANPITRYSRRPLGEYVEGFRRLCQDYQPDFCVMALNRGCKHDLLWAGTVRKEAHRLNIPVYPFEFDMLDSRVESEESVIHGLGSFIMDITQGKPDKIRVHQSIITAGIDIGSTASKAALWQGDHLLAWHISPSTINPTKTAADCYRAVLEKAGLGEEDVAYIVGTGYGRAKVAFADENVSEISCHGRGALALIPSVRTILDIGGQDTKAISVDGDGRLLDFSMNDKCAAGTGKFLEFTCRGLDIDMHDLAALHFQHNGGEAVRLSTVCSVFLESEIINLINERHSLPDVVYSLHQVVAKKVISQGKRVGLKRDVVVSGGVAKNKGVIDAIEGILGYPTQTLPESIDPQIIGAIGAAVIAQDK